MEAIAAGKFLMGSPAREPGRFDSEGPQHVVSLKAFALAKYPVTSAEFLNFLRATGYRPKPCNATLNLGWQAAGRGLAYPPSENEPPHWPAVCLDHQDALAYVAWINTQAKAAHPTVQGAPYRLPSEAEWEYAARAGAKGENWLPGTLSDSCRYANVSDETFHNDYPKVTNFAPCNDGHSFTAPVASYQPNSFGLYDTVGNAWEWNEDCAHDSYDGAPVDGSAWVANGDCVKRVRRGGSWYRVGGYNRSALPGADWHGQGGVRVARDL